MQWHLDVILGGRARMRRTHHEYCEHQETFELLKASERLTRLNKLFRAFRRFQTLSDAFRAFRAFRPQTDLSRLRIISLKNIQYVVEIGHTDMYIHITIYQ